jgi:Na+-translocating ferredoxin:NAD+ oxidoreductase RnfC subunit
VVLVPENFTPKTELLLPEGEVEYIKVETDTSYYPVGGKRDIISYMKKRRKDVRVSLKDLFIDSSTLYDVYEAVVYNQPVIDKFIQIAGHAVYGEGILKVRLGTSIRSLIAEFGGFIKDGGKIIVNGILMGHNVLLPFSEK